MILKIADFFIGTFSGALIAKVVSYISPPFMPMLTGGLIGKIECATEMANYGETWITNLELLKGFFEKKPLGSKVVH